MERLKPEFYEYSYQNHFPHQSLLISGVDQKQAKLPSFY